MVLKKCLKTFPHNLHHKGTLNFEILLNVEISSCRQQSLSGSGFATWKSDPGKLLIFSPGAALLSLCVCGKHLYLF